MKTCTRCKKEKSLESFRKDERYFDGYTSWCRSCFTEYNRSHNKKYRAQNPELVKGWRKEEYVRNKPRYEAYRKEYYAENTKLFLYYGKTYKCSVIQATPKWLTEEQKRQIKDIYKTCPPGYHVDHIVPLRGKEVCGLHVPWNLQHLPAEENLSKSNKVVGV